MVLPTFTFKNMKLGIKPNVSPVFVWNTSKSQFRTCRLLTSHFRTKSYFYLIFFLKCIFLFWKNKCICSGNNASNDKMTCQIDSFFCKFSFLFCGCLCETKMLVWDQNVEFIHRNFRLRCLFAKWASCSTDTIFSCKFCYLVWILISEKML